LKRALRAALNNASAALFAVLLATFGFLAPAFFTPANLLNIAGQSASNAIVATGMTFVLLVAGVDLSVGAIMFVAAAVAGKMAMAGMPLWQCIGAMTGIGLAAGFVNALLVTRLRIVAFIATLGTLYIGRGFGTWLTDTKAMNVPDSTFPALVFGRWAGVPAPIVLLLGVVAMAQITLSSTAFGRQLYAVGYSAESARKAGVNTRRITASAYILCGLGAALGAVLTLGQLGSVSPKFGEYREFSAISAAVLGGTSLFGGRGRVFPGTILGALLIQSIENGLVLLNADIYLYPLITSAIIFTAVLVDTLRLRLQESA
jgi:ribose transport system permease protein